MLKFKLILVSVLAVLSPGVMAGPVFAHEGADPKVTVCHKFGSSKQRLIEVSHHAQPVHLAHGDQLFTCSP